MTVLLTYLLCCALVSSGESQVVSCKGGHAVDDDYCDCEDGSDEPNTAACAGSAATFVCSFRGLEHSRIPTSRGE